MLDKDSKNIIDAYQGQLMFPSELLDTRGEIPEPFNFERYNFNPHELMGDFDYKNDQPELLRTNKGTLADKSGRKVNKHGWLTTPEGHLVDYSGRKRFDHKQTTPDGGIPKLYTYEAKRFDIRDVMGIFEKDLTSGAIVPVISDNGLLDTKGRLCNSKGYLTDEHGNIIDINGRQLWR